MILSDLSAITAKLSMSEVFVLHMRERKNLTCSFDACNRTD